MKKILIVSPYFAPENSVASIRFTKIAKYLQRLGHDVTVICTQMNANMQKDKTLAEDLKTLKNINRVNYSHLYYKLKQRFGTEKKIKKEKNSITKDDSNKNIIQKNNKKDTLIWCYTNVFSFILGRRYIRYIKAKNETYDVVISTFAPLSSHMLGHYMKKKKKCKVWIADFRDSMTMLNSDSCIAPAVKKYGAHLIKRADYITCVSKGTIKKLTEETAELHNDLSKKMRLITNGFDIEDRKAIQDIDVLNGKIVFAYCGTLYNIGGKLKTNMQPLFRALRELIIQGKIDKSKLEIRYAGYDSELFESLAKKFDINDITKCYGRVSREQSMRLQRQSDVILVSVWNNRGEEGILSGKFFETLAVQRNVLCLITGNLGGSELASVVRKTGCGYAYEEINGDQSGMPQLEEWILQIYNEKMKNGKLFYKNDNVDKFSHQALAKQFEKLFEPQRKLVRQR